jgi:hypothetical protein
MSDAIKADIKVVNKDKPKIVHTVTAEAKHQTSIPVQGQIKNKTYDPATRKLEVETKGQFGAKKYTSMIIDDGNNGDKTCVWERTTDNSNSVQTNVQCFDRTINQQGKIEGKAIADSALKNRLVNAAQPKTDNKTNPAGAVVASKTNQPANSTPNGGFFNENPVGVITKEVGKGLAAGAIVAGAVAGVTAVGGAAVATAPVWLTVGAVGALAVGVGSGIEYLDQRVIQGKAHKDIDKGRVISSGAVNAIAPGVGGMVAKKFGTSVVAKLASGGVTAGAIGVGSSTFEQTINNGGDITKVDLGKAAKDGGMAALFGVGTTGAGIGLKKAFSRPTTPTSGAPVSGLTSESVAGPPSGPAALTPLSDTDRLAKALNDHRDSLTQATAKRQAKQSDLAMKGMGQMTRQQHAQRAARQANPQASANDLQETATATAATVGQRAQELVTKRLLDQQINALDLRNRLKQGPSQRSGALTNNPASGSDTTSTVSVGNGKLTPTGATLPTNNPTTSRTTPGAAISNTTAPVNLTEQVSHTQNQTALKARVDGGETVSIPQLTALSPLARLMEPTVINGHVHPDPVVGNLQIIPQAKTDLVRLIQQQWHRIASTDRALLGGSPEAAANQVMQEITGSMGAKITPIKPEVVKALTSLSPDPVQRQKLYEAASKLFGFTPRTTEVNGQSVINASAAAKLLGEAMTTPNPIATLVGRLSQASTGRPSLNTKALTAEQRNLLMAVHQALPEAQQLEGLKTMLAGGDNTRYQQILTKVADLLGHANDTTKTEQTLLNGFKPQLLTGSADDTPSVIQQLIAAARQQQYLPEGVKPEIIHLPKATQQLLQQVAQATGVSPVGLQIAGLKASNPKLTNADLAKQLLGLTANIDLPLSVVASRIQGLLNQGANYDADIAPIVTAHLQSLPGGSNPLAVEAGLAAIQKVISGQKPTKGFQTVATATVTGGNQIDGPDTPGIIEATAETASLPQVQHPLSLPAGGTRHNEAVGHLKQNFGFYGVDPSDLATKLKGNRMFNRSRTELAFATGYNNQQLDDIATQLADPKTAIATLAQLKKEIIAYTDRNNPLAKHIPWISQLIQ